jgi:hypothetical protein
LSPAPHSDRTSRLPSLVAGGLRFAPAASDSLARAPRARGALGGTRHRLVIYKQSSTARGRF